MSSESVMPSNHLILCHPLLFLPSIFPSIRIFSNESVLCIRWPKYWSFSFSISPSNEYSGVVWSPCSPKDYQSLLQHHSSKASILWWSVFFIVQLSHPYMTIGKNIALTRWTFFGKVMSLLFNMLSRLGSWWWTGRPGVLRFMGLQRVGHDWATELTDGGIVDLQCCVSFKHMEKWISYASAYIHHFFRFYFHIDHYRVLNRGLCATWKVLINISLIQTSVYMSVPSSNVSAPP